MPLTPVPALDRTSATFKNDVDDFFGTRIPTMVSELSSLQADVTAKQSAAAASAITATADAAAADAAKTAAQAAQATAQAAAASAVLSPGTSATSVSNLAVGTGSKSLTIDTGKAIVVGMSVKIASTASPSNWLHGDVQSYNSATGALVVQVSTINGSGTFTAWTISLSAPGGSTTDFTSLTNKPTTIAGYGITDGQLKNPPLTDLGTITAGGTAAFNLASEFQRAQAAGNTTITLSGWPTTGKLAQALLKLVNFGGKTITFPTINWIKADGTVTTTFSALGIPLKTTGTDMLVIWSDDAGATVYGKFIR